MHTIDVAFSADDREEVICAGPQTKFRKQIAQKKLILTNKNYKN